MSTDFCPSPTPPWHRPTLSPQTETFTEDNDAGTLSLTMDVSYLDSAVLKAAPEDPYVAVLPDGNSKRQTKRLFIASDKAQTSAPWKITGRFADFGWLLFTKATGLGGMSAVLEWDGAAWFQLGGNAVPQN